MGLKKLLNLIAGPVGGLVILLFFLPWVSVSCSGGDFIGGGEQTLVKGSGYDLAQGFDNSNVKVVEDTLGLEFDETEGNSDLSFNSGDAVGFTENGEDSEFQADPLMYLFPLIGLLAIIAAGIGWIETRLINPITSFGLYIVPTVLGLILLLYKYISLSDEIDTANALINTEQAAQSEGFALTLELLKLNIEYGWWLSGVGLLVLLVIGIILFVYQESGGNLTGQPADWVSSASSAGPSTESDFMFISESPEILLGEARGLIKERRFDEARAVLNRLNHPKASEWLAKLDEIDPPQF